MTAVAVTSFTRTCANEVGSGGWSLPRPTAHLCTYRTASHTPHALAPLQEEDENSGDEDDDGVVWMTDTSAEAAKRRAQEQLTAATAAMVTVGNLEAEQEAARRKAEREAKKAAEEEARKKVGRRRLWSALGPAWRLVIQEGVHGHRPGSAWTQGAAACA